MMYVHNNMLHIIYLIYYG